MTEFMGKEVTLQQEGEDVCVMLDGYYLLTLTKMDAEERGYNDGKPFLYVHSFIPEGTLDVDSVNRPIVARGAEDFSVMEPEFWRS